MPTLYILAGPNGAGKTTFYFTAIKEGFINKEIPFINTDLVVRNELGAYSEENFIKAEAIVRDRISKHISNEENFMIESNLAKQSDYNWLKKVKARGYGITIYFLCTNKIDINKKRVKKRVKEGGHDVPENIIEHRYKMALIYLRAEILNFDEVHLIENSGRRPEEIAVVKDGKIVKKKDSNFEWVNKVLYLAEKLTHIAAILKKVEVFQGFDFFKFRQGDYKFFTGERLGFILQCSINSGYCIRWFAELPYDDLLIMLIVHCGGYYFLCIHYSYNITPLIFDTFLFKLIT